MLRNSCVIGAAAIAVVSALDASPVSAQTYQACRVPLVGVIYMINVGDAPTACLDPSHVQFSWTEGGAPPANSVTSATIVDATIATIDIADDAVTSAKIAAGTIAAADLAAGSVSSTAIVDGTVLAADLSAGAVASAAVLDNSLVAADIAPDGVGASEIAAGAVGASELLDAAITHAEFDPGIFRFVKVLSTGSVFSSLGTVSGTRTALGTYELTFAQTLGSQGNCALIGAAAEGAHIVQTIHGTRYAGGTNFTMRVMVYSAAGTTIDAGFEVGIICST